MNFLNLSLIICAVLASHVYADPKISIISPTKLADMFKDEDIQFSTGHYGIVPYGTHLVGNLVLANPIEACEPLERFSKGEGTYQQNIIAVVKRGGCRITVKSRHAQQAGAKVVLIVDDRDTTTLSEWFGHEQGAEDIKVPSIMVTRTVGEKIVKYLQRSDLKEPEYESGIVIINFPYDPKSDHVRLDFWYSVADVFKSTYLFLKHLRGIVERNGLDFYPHFVTWTSGAGKRQNFQYRDDPDCISGGRYCAPDPDDAGPLTGSDVVFEDLRQACVFKTSSELWWKYVTIYGSSCLKADNIGACGRDILSSLGTSSDRDKITTCIEDSFEVPPGYSRNYDEKLDDNKILREEKELQLEYTINSFPVLFINHKPFYGNLHHPHLVLEEACKSMLTLTPDCRQLLHMDTNKPLAESHKGRVVFVLIVMSIIALVIFYCCRRMIKREGKDMSMQVGGMVTRYFALKDIKEGGKDDENDG